MAGASPVVDQYYTFAGNQSTSGNRTPPVEINQAVEITAYVYFSSGAAAGKVQLQTTNDLSLGVWANVGSTIDWAAGNTVKYASSTGVFKYICANIDTTVTSGTVRLYLLAMPV